uniref:Uncharacterized protein n=1 Tax=Ditylenchus dipsaci TaxID=166011 RepID=A0A915EES3_9BILA
MAAQIIEVLEADPSSTLRMLNTTCLPLIQKLPEEQKQMVMPIYENVQDYMKVKEVQGMVPQELMDKLPFKLPF